MSIEIKSNRNLIVKMFIPILIASVIFSIICLILFIIESHGMENMLIFSLSITIGIAGSMLFIKYKEGPKYIFDEDKILVYDKGVELNKIQISDIDYMYYYPFYWRYILALFLLASIPETMKLHVVCKYGETVKLGFISLKDANRLKELYPELLTLRL